MSSNNKDKNLYSKERERSRSDSHKHKREERHRHRVSKWSDGPSKLQSNENNTNNIYPNTIYPQNIMTSNSYININDNTKIKKKIYIPKLAGVNYVGLLIGPKGVFQKRLENQSGCKILVRGKGTQKEGMPPQPDDHEEQHVLIMGDTEENIKRATYLVEQILYANEDTRTKIKDEQIKVSQKIRTEQLLKDGIFQNNIKNFDENGEEKPIIQKYLMTPYGPPDKNARIFPVPDDCVGLIIGKNGETIRRLNRESGCKIQIAVEPVPNSTSRNVFIEGPTDKYEIAKKLIEEIVSEQIAMKQSAVNTSSNSHLGEVNLFPGPYTCLKIPNKMVGLIIGRNGETVRSINQFTGCYIYIPKESRPGEDFRELQLSGSPEQVAECKKEILSMIQLALYGRMPFLNNTTIPNVESNKNNDNKQLQNENININNNSDNKANNYNDNNTSPEKHKDHNNEIDINKNENSGKKNNKENSNINENKQNEIKNPIPQNMNMIPPNFSQMPNFSQNLLKNNFPKINPYEIFTVKKQNPLQGLTYNLENYYDPVNYFLYFQNIYPMYPQLTEYYKKFQFQNEYINNGIKQQQNSLSISNNNSHIGANTVSKENEVTN